MLRLSPWTLRLPVRRLLSPPLRPRLPPPPLSQKRPPPLLLRLRRKLTSETIHDLKPCKVFAALFLLLIFRNLILLLL